MLTSHPDRRAGPGWEPRLAGCSYKSDLQLHPCAVRKSCHGTPAACPCRPRSTALPALTALYRSFVAMLRVDLPWVTDK